jgi:hypothetical protein
MASAVFTQHGSAASTAMGHSMGHAMGTGYQAAMPTAANVMMLPRCTMRLEKCKGGMKLWCSCADEIACGTLQNLCQALCDGLCSCCCTMNGIPCCQVNLCCGICKCENTKDGVCITCLSGDKACCDLIQACCDCLSQCLESGCCCYVSFGNTPVCCGCC